MARRGEVGPRGSIPAIARPITQRQRQVFIAVMRRCGSKKEAARQLGITVHTVGMHLRQVYERSDAHGLIEASINLGFTQLPEDDAST